MQEKNIYDQPIPTRGKPRTKASKYSILKKTIFWLISQFINSVYPERFEQFTAIVVMGRLPAKISIFFVFFNVFSSLKHKKQGIIVNQGEKACKLAVYRACECIFVFNKQSCFVILLGSKVSFMKRL